jgi:hypothetical protein
MAIDTTPAGISRGAIRGNVGLRKPERCYEKRKTVYQRLHGNYEAIFNRCYHWKMAVFWGGLGLLVLACWLKSYPGAGAILALGILLFAWLDVRQVRAMKRRDRAGLLARINQDSLQRLNGEWPGFADTGAEFADPDHPFSGDLDLFGPGSLFQWINTATTFLGRRRLAHILAGPLPGVEEIRERQEAVAELGSFLGWRQEFQAEGLAVAGRMGDPEFLFKWAGERDRLTDRPWAGLGIRVLPVVTGLLMVSSLWLKLPFYLPGAALAVHYILLRLGRKERKATFDALASYAKNIEVYQKLLETFESKAFHSKALAGLRRSLVGGDGQAAFRQIERLARIADAVSNRSNAFYFFFNLIMLWDYQCQLSLAQWKEQSGKLLRVWLEALATVEALSSLALIQFDHPGWPMPLVTDGAPRYSARGLAHPLLPESRVANDLFIEKPARVLLVTGSNMSGKSTYLRSAGINLALAYAGAPVCARSLTCSGMEIHTCMRVGDNLGQNLSTFYAEVLRIKRIVEAARAERPVFFLLDEIFKGTNSLDRHAGAKLLIRKLVRAGAVGMVSTHDLELASLEEESGGRVKNVHFQEEYRGDRIHFDYRLRPGVSTTRNALFLIRSAGIEVETEESWEE